MKVIIREEISIGSGTDIDVYEHNPKKKDCEQLQKLIDDEANWFKSAKIEVEEKKVDADKAYIYGEDYSVYYFIRECKEMES